MIIKQKCKICGTGYFSNLKKYARFIGMDGERSTIIACNNCGVITRKPSLFEGVDIKALAPAALRETKVFVGGDANRPSAHFLERLRFAETQVKQKKMLDIGCGTGSFLKLAKERGWQVTGTEFTQETVVKLNAEQIECFHGDLTNPGLQGRTFDLIHLNHVFEHVEDPIALLKDAQRLLADDGMILIEVPNEFSSLVQTGKRLLGFSGASTTNFFEHEWFFSPQTLARTIEYAGLKTKKLFTPVSLQGISSPLLRFIHTISARMGYGANIEAHIVKNT